MNKIAKSALVIGLIMCLVGGIMLAYGFANNGAEHLRNTNFDTNKLYKSKTFDYDSEIKNIDIDVELYQVIIQKSFDNKTHVSVKSDNLKHLGISTENQNLKIAQTRKYGKRKRPNINLNILNEFIGEHNDPEIIISLTDAVYDNVRVNVDIGTLEVNNLSAKNLQVTTDIGDVELSGVSILSGSIKSDTGSIDIEKSTLSEFSLDVDTGSVNIEDSTLKNFLIRNDIGSVDISDSTYDGGEIFVDTGSLEEDNVRYITPVKKHGQYVNESEHEE